jgi:gp16 family phage-associated protein
MPTKTRKQARTDFDRRGISIASWARENDFSEHLVYQVLSGAKKGRRGAAHNIAVALGIKEGVANTSEHGKISNLQLKYIREEK